MGFDGPAIALVVLCSARVEGHCHRGKKCDCLRSAGLDVHAIKIRCRGQCAPSSLVVVPFLGAACAFGQCRFVRWREPCRSRHTVGQGGWPTVPFGWRPHGGIHTILAPCHVWRRPRDPGRESPSRNKSRSTWGTTTNSSSAGTRALGIWRRKPGMRNATRSGLDCDAGGTRGDAAREAEFRRVLSWL